MIEFEEPQDGDWIRPIMNGYLMKCCDCGLVHRMAFRVVKAVNKTHQKILSPAHRVEFQASRHEP